jgi:selenide,water dikinase
VWAKGGARPGNVLVLTKALGTGVITTAHKQGTAADEHLQPAVAGMTRLNRAAAEAALTGAGVLGLTDITGFGLLGHAHEMAHLSGTALELDYAALPWLPGAREYAERWIFPGGSERNEAYYGPWTRFEPGLGLSDWEKRLLHDPQTSGGLLMAVAEAEAAALVERLLAGGDLAAVIGRVVDGPAGEIRVR